MVTMDTLRKVAEKGKGLEETGEKGKMLFGKYNPKTKTSGIIKPNTATE